MNEGHCAIPERHGSVHCAACLTGSFVLREGQVCPNGVRLEDLPLETAAVRAGKCLTCEERKREIERAGMLEESG